MMRIIHVVPYIGEEASGPAYTTTALNNMTNELGMASQLAVTTDNYKELGSSDYTLRTFQRHKFLRRLGHSPEMIRWLSTEVASGTVDVIHNHSIWMMPNVYTGWVTRGRNIPLIVSPRGTFSKWAMNRSRVVKFLFWHALQKRSLAHTALFHATAENEYEDIRRMGYRQPVAIIPNGIDMPQAKAPSDKSKKTLLFLGRIHPVKGLDVLLSAWAELQTAFPEWHLRIVGPGNVGYVAEMQALANSIAAERVVFTGPLYGEEKTQAYQSADLFVLPTHSENFGIAIAEALAAGCPVVTTKGAPWSGLPIQRAGWWIDIGVDPLKRALHEAMSKYPSELTEMGARGRAWMERDFAWKQIAAQMIESYRWVREGGTPPTWIRND
ncbi:glycosyltransferase [Pseudochrobactrum kiredjianiae]|uniref:Glycosyltransferase n=1 Tax=Pseudochrobactrum kiredjianiae TaxID=386305 RepID=A0ABW3V1T0_9HYPH|nr:glycosyltransferase [Pseudochrobactrum kiredjianiae]MDM7852519.1 glycosyltransferase [Pseudochrobactrum kiredjianiae]